jgi:hypothetical protein
MWSAWAVVFLDLGYLATGAAWLLFGGDAVGRDPLWPVDPFRAVLEVIILLLTPPVVLLMAAVHTQAPRGTRTCSAAALAFMVLMAGTTGGIHFVELTVVRRLETAAVPGLSIVFFSPWPSIFFALDLFAWDVFLGLSLLCAAPVFQGGGLTAAVRVSLLLSGALCLAGTLGPALGDLRFQLLAVLGYAFVFPVACLLLALLFGRTEPSAETAVTH